jgi:penicillin-binding protein 2
MENYEDRKYIIGGLIILVAVIYIFKLLSLQVFDQRYKSSAENNSQRHVTEYPARGLIYDRNGKHLVYNEAAYDLMFIPKQSKDFDTLELISVLNITKEDLKLAIEKAKHYSWYKPSIIVKQISNVTYAKLQEKMYKFEGFYVQARTIRKYPRPIAAHMLGYLGEVDTSITNHDKYYKSGDYIGVSGIEKSYEKELRGVKGKKIYLVDVHNRIQGDYANGKYDVQAVAGTNLTATIDIDLQEYGELLMQNKIGSIVAIEPKTGEILAFISSPTYDPNLLVGRKRTKNYPILSTDSLKPLFNRALAAKYSPGSTFKLVQALIGLQDGLITPETGFICNKNLVGCHNHPNATNVQMAIKMSCNPYFYQVYRRIIEQHVNKSIYIDARFGLEYWDKYVYSFGLGTKLDIDIPGVKKGNIPNIAFYDKWYGKNRWAFTYIASNSIGQGEVEIVPIQIANLAAIIANNGYYYTPHFVKAIGNTGKPRDKYTYYHKTLIDEKWFSLIKAGMFDVVNTPGGTARRARIPNIDVCGKTGTVQNSHGEDHSGFIAFAPMDNPQIAIAVYVENAGFGGTWAAPIASLMIEKYLTDSISNKTKEQRILDADFIHKKK